MGERTRFWSKVDVRLPEECWPWTAAMGPNGYGHFIFRGRHTTAHRAAYILTNGDPGELQVDHLCRNRACCNPAHLDAVTNRENTLRGLKGRMVTECAHGHQYTDENTGLTKEGRRFCRSCRAGQDRRRHDAAYWREYRRKRRGRSDKNTVV